MNRLIAFLMAVTAIVSMTLLCFADDGEEVEVVETAPADSQFVDTLNVDTVNLYVEADAEAEAQAAAMAAAEVYTITDDVQYGAYFHANVSDLGEVYIYVPVAAATDCFSYDASGIPINITASSITGYVAGSSSNQSIQFPSFGVPRWRVSNQYDYEYVTSWDDIDSSVTVYSNDDAFSSYNETYWLKVIAVAVLAYLVLNFLIRLLGGMR